MDRLTEEREEMDFRAGVIAATIVNVNKTKSSKVVQPHDIIPKRSKEGPRQDGPKQSVEEMIRVAKQWTVIHGGTIEVN